MSRSLMADAFGHHVLAPQLLIDTGPEPPAIDAWDYTLHDGRVLEVRAGS